MAPTGLLLSNLGSPDSASTTAVRAYLRQFLMDGRVLDIPWVSRQLLVRGIIAPFRGPRSARAYARIWTESGSPLVSHSRDLAVRTAERLGEDWRVALGMRYGNPSLGTALDQLVAEGCRRIVVMPLYPQYASATTGSTLQEIWRLASRYQVVPEIVPSSPFYEDPGFLRCVASRVATCRTDPSSHVLFSFHGLPERQIRKADATGTCLTGGCCEGMGAERGCYKAQCHRTARGVATLLGLEREQWSIGFQSRLGRTAWIGPSTEDLARELPGRGVRNLVVATPSFVADCLETLEEIGMGLSRTFLGSGGREFRLAPCPNAEPDWVAEVCRTASFLSCPGI